MKQKTLNKKGHEGPHCCSPPLELEKVLERAEIWDLILKSITNKPIVWNIIYSQPNLLIALIIGSPYSYIPYLLDYTVFEDSLPVLVVFAI